MPQWPPCEASGRPARTARTEGLYLYGARAVDMVRLLAGHLLLAHSRAACIGPLSRVELVIPLRLSSSDFRLTSHVSHNRTERALQLASQHVVAGAAVLVLPELSSSHVPQGAIVCG